MRFFEALNNNFDNPDVTEPALPGCYNIHFVVDGRDDEVQFDIKPGDNLMNLVTLWSVFAAENRIPTDAVESVSYAEPDAELKEEVDNVQANGMVFLRYKGENVYLTPEEVKAVYAACTKSIFASKQWGREDISSILEEEMEKRDMDASGISDADWEGLIDDVIDEGASWNGLKECDDSEWNIIRDNVRAILDKIDVEEAV